MPKFLDAHSLRGTDEETLKELQNAPADEFGIKHVNLSITKKKTNSFVLLKHPTKVQYKNITVNTALTVNG